jgi:hypothetical protein
MLHHSGEVAVADLNHRVSIFDAENGDFVRKFGLRGKTDGHFDYPTAIVSDMYGNFIVLDQGTERMQLFGCDGKHLLTRSDLGVSSSSVHGVAWSPEEGLAVANGHANNARAWWPT